MHPDLPRMHTGAVALIQRIDVVGVFPVCEPKPSRGGTCGDDALTLILYRCILLIFWWNPSR